MSQKNGIRKLKWLCFVSFICVCAFALGFYSAFHNVAYAAGAGGNFLNAPTSRSQVVNGNHGSETATSANDLRNIYTLYEPANKSNTWSGGRLSTIPSQGAGSFERTGKYYSMNAYNDLPSAEELRTVRNCNFMAARNWQTKESALSYIGPTVKTQPSNDSTVLPNGSASDIMKYTYISWGNSANSGVAFVDYVLQYVVIKLGTPAQMQIQSGAISSFSATINIYEIGANGKNGDSRVNAFMAFANGDAQTNLCAWTSSGQSNSYWFAYSNPGGSSKNTNNKSFSLTLNSSSYEEGDNLLVIGVFSRNYFTNPWNWSAKEVWMSYPTVSSFSASSSLSAKTLNGNAHHTDANNYDASRMAFNGGAMTSRNPSLNLAANASSATVDAQIANADDGYFFMGYNVYLASGSPLFLYKKKLTFEYSDTADVRMDALLTAPAGSIVWTDIGYGKVPALSATEFYYTGSAVSITAPSLTDTNTRLTGGKQFNKAVFRTEVQYADENGNILLDAPKNIGSYKVRVAVYYNESYAQNATQSNWNGIKNGEIHIKKVMTDADEEYGMMLGHSAWQTLSILPRAVSLSNLQTELEFNGNTQTPTFTATKDRGSLPDFNFTVTGGQRNAGTYTLTIALPNTVKDENGNFYFAFTYPSDYTGTSNGNIYEFSYIIKRKYLGWNVSAGNLTYNGATQSAPFTLEELQGVISGTDVSLSSGGELTGKNVGDYTANFTLTGADAGNYTFQQDTDVIEKTAVWHIVPAKITVTLENLADGEVHLTYNGVNQTPRFGTDGWWTQNTPSDTQSNLLTSNIAPVKDASVNTAVLNLATNGNYTFADGTYSYTFQWHIDRRQLVFTAADRTTQYGDALNVPQSGAQGFTNRDFTRENYQGTDINLSFDNAVTLSLGDGLTVGCDAGSYEIILTVDETSAIHNNYAVSCVNGTYTVTPRTVAYALENKTANYGESVTFTGSTQDDVLNADLQSGKVTVEYTHDGGLSTGGYVNAGSHNILATLNDGTGKASNFELTLSDAVYRVTAKSLTIELKVIDATYGEPVSFDGKWVIKEGQFLDGDDARVAPYIQGNPEKLIRGTYSAYLAFSGNDGGNYSVKPEYAQGTYSQVNIRIRDVQYRIDSVTGVYGDTFRRVGGIWSVLSGVTLSGGLSEGSMAYDDNVSAITETLRINANAENIVTTASGHLAVGSYPGLITGSAISNDNTNPLYNYRVTYVGDAAVTVTSKTIEADVQPMTVKYGDEYPAGNTFGTFTEPAAGDDVLDLWLFEIYQRENESLPIPTTVKNGKTYITAIPGDNYLIRMSANPDSALKNNYNFTSGTAKTFTVTKRMVALSFPDQNEVYGVTLADIRAKLASYITLPPEDAVFPELPEGQSPFTVNLSLGDVTVSENDYLPVRTYELPVILADEFTAKYGISSGVTGRLIIEKAQYNLNDIVFENLETPYDGQIHRPVITQGLPVGLDGVALTVDYQGSAKYVTDGTITVTATFRSTSSNYYTPDAMTATVTILPREVTVSATNQSAVYSGAEPSVNAEAYTISEGDLVSGDALGIYLVKAAGVSKGEYPLTFFRGDSAVSERVSRANTGTVVLQTGNPNYTITAQDGVFIIEPKDITNKPNASENTMEIMGILTGGYVYTGNAIRPAISVADRGLAEGAQNLTTADYIINYGSNAEAGKAGGVIRITGKGNFTGTYEYYFEIRPKAFSNQTVSTGAIENLIYDALPKQPAPTVSDKDRNVNLTRGKDYTFAYANNTNAGESAQVIITGQGNYEGSVTVTFTILPCDISAVSISTIEPRIYCRDIIRPTPTVRYNGALTEGVDFTYSYGSNTYAGQGAGTVTVRGMGNFKGNRTVRFDILKKELTVRLQDDYDMIYDGRERSLEVSFDGVITGDVVPTPKFRYYFAGSMIETGTLREVGDYIAEVYIDESSNYSIPANTTVKFSIGAYSVGIYWNIPELTYCGDSLTVGYQPNMGMGNITARPQFTVRYFFITAQGEKEVDAPYDAGEYIVRAELSNDAVNKNFILANQLDGTPVDKEKTFRVGKASLTATPGLFEKVFGNPDGEFIGSVNGLGADGELSVRYTREFSCSAEEWLTHQQNGTLNFDWRDYERAGAVYQFANVEFWGAGDIRNSANYDLVLRETGHGGGLQINARTIDKIAPYYEKNYGETDPELMEDWETGYYGIRAKVSYVRESGNNAGSYNFTSFTIMLATGGDTVMEDYNNFTVRFARDGGRNRFVIHPVQVAFYVADAEKTFGDADPEFTYRMAEGAQLLPGVTVTFTREEGEYAAVAGYRIGLNLSDPNYIAEIRTEEGWTGRLYVKPLKITTEDDIITERLYNSTNIATARSVSNNIPVAYQTATNFRVIAEFTQSDAGDEIDINVTYTVNERMRVNYILPEDRVIKGGIINPRTLKVWIDDFTIEYGEEMPEVSLRYDGFINGDNASAIWQEPTINWGDFTGSMANANYVYTITLENDGVAMNYVFDVSDTATVRVERAPLMISVKEGTGTYVQTANGSNTVTLGNDWFEFVGLKHGDTATVLHTAVLESVEPGDTNIIVTFTESDLGNYYLVNRTVSIPAFLKPLPVITVSDVHTVYNGEQVAVRPSVSVIHPGTGSILQIGYSVRYVNAKYDSDVAPAGAGKYTVIVESVDDYYDTVRAESTLEIEKANVRISISGKTKQTYGEFSPLTAVARGTDKVFDLTPAYPFGNTDRPVAGTHTVRAIFEGNENYLPASASVELKIEPRALQVVFSDYQNLVYNGKQQPLTATFFGVLAGDDCQPIISYSSGVVPKDAGTYHATVMPSNPSYTISGNMMQVYTIQKRQLTVTADGGVVNAGERPDTQLIFDGFVQGEDVGNIRDLPNVNISGISVGENKIYLSGGDDKNYDFVLEPGKFVVVYEKEATESKSSNIIWIVLGTLVVVALLILIIAIVSKKRQEREYAKERAHRVHWRD